MGILCSIDVMEEFYSQLQKALIGSEKTCNRKQDHYLAALCIMTI